MKRNRGEAVVAFLFFTAWAYMLGWAVVDNTYCPEPGQIVRSAGDGQYVCKRMNLIP